MCQFLTTTQDKSATSIFEIKFETLQNFKEEFPDNEIIINELSESECLIT